MRTRLVLLATLGCTLTLSAWAATRSTLLMNRLGPSQMVLYMMNADGSDQRMLTRSRWEDSMPAIVPANAR